MTFLVLAIVSGGKSFRWFGDTVKEISYALGEVADLFNKASEDIKSATQAIGETGSKIKNIASETGQTASDIVNTTSIKAEGLANSTGVIMDEVKNAVSADEPDVEGKAGSESEKKRKRTATKDAKD